LDPSVRLTQGYFPVIIATNEGQVLSGLIQTETAMHVEIINANGKLIRVARDTIAERCPTQVSVMPDRLTNNLSAREFTDLVDFLMTVR
jgi:putative heme-binding domain-containing protein